VNELTQSVSANPRSVFDYAQAARLTCRHERFYARTGTPPRRGNGVERYPEMVRKAVAALCVEHLGCREWEDDAALHYKSTGRDEQTIIVTNFTSAAPIALSGIAHGTDRRGVILKGKTTIGGEGRFLAAAGVPTIGLLPNPSYLVAAPPNGYIERVS